jgi:hypothetical protein
MTANPQSTVMRLTPRSILARGAMLIAAMFLVISLLTRLALMVQGRHDIAWNLSLVGSFGIGLGYDLLAACYAVVPWFLLTLLLPSALWRSKAACWVLSFLLLLYAVVFIFIGVADCFFWDELRVRWHVIAVSSLIHIQEMIDSMEQPYLTPLISTGLALAGSGVVWVAWKLGAVRWVCAGDSAWKLRMLPVLGTAIVVIGASNVFSESQLPNFNNEFNRELAKDGPYSLCVAVRRYYFSDCCHHYP